MSNLYMDAQQAGDNNFFTYNRLNGLNEKGSGQSKIKFVGEFDPFTKKTLYENYDLIAQNLKVYPTITIYPRGYELKGGFEGFYYSDQNHIDLIDQYFLISMLAHEMRHAFQYIYIPDIYFNTSYSSAREYLDCEIERDARAYSLDYCVVREYWEEAEHLKKEENEIESVISNELLPSVRGLSEGYFFRNPFKTQIVPRTYHLDQNSNNVVSVSTGPTRKWRKTRIGILLFAAVVILTLFMPH